MAKVLCEQGAKVLCEQGAKVISLTRRAVEPNFEVLVVGFQVQRAHSQLQHSVYWDGLESTLETVFVFRNQCFPE